MIEKSNIKDIYPLSPMQEGMLFHALENPGSLAYFEQVSYRVSGPLSIPLFRKAWQYLVDRHDILRTAFLHERTRRPLQVVLKQRPMEITEHHAQPDTIAAHRAEEKQRGFNLREDSLLRARILTLAPGTFEVILSFHHILMDGWCMGILNAEFLHVYEALRTGQSPSLPPPVPYQRYVQWLERQDKSATLHYWQKQLDDLAAPSPLPLRKPTSEPYRLERLHATLGPGAAASLRSLAASWGVTVNSLMQTAWALVLSRYTGLDDVLYGAIVSGRPAEVPDVDRILGLFINLIPIRARLEPNSDCRSLARQLHSSLLDAMPHSYCSISDIAANTPFRHNLLDHILVFENYPGTAAPSGPLQVQFTDRFEQTNYGFVIVIAPGESIDVAFHYNASAFDAAAIARLQANYIHTLSLLATNPQLHDIDALCPAESQILRHWSTASRIDLPVSTLTARFEAQAAATPDAIAIHDQGITWTYRDLDALSNGLAAALRAHALAPEDRAAVLLPRSRWMPLALIGALKAAAVYLPIDPETPPDRLRYYLADSAAKVLLTAGPLEGQWPIPTLDLTTIAPAPPQPANLHPEQLAYAIYTSGSTGQPKAVAISHHAALNLTEWHRHAFRTNETSRATLFASPAFDASLWEMLPYLLTGGSLYPVPPEDRADTERLILFYTRHAITHTFLPPAVCEEVGKRHNGRCRSMLFLAGGDVLKSTAGFDANLYNNYGPTESAVVATSILLTGEEERIPIGKPVSNTEILILDPHGRPSPIGVPGELHIASTSLARGYLNRPALTADRFRPHPAHHGARLYRTGDLGYWNNGAIVFAGRNDHQVKLNGIRIELGEIEAAFEQHPAVTEAVAGLTHSQLNVWIATAAPITAAGLRQFAARRLPAAMLPTRIHLLEALPRTRNGKIDRAALTSTDNTPRLRRAPATPVQLQLAAIWSEVLGTPDISIDDDFFELGGHSLTVTRAVSRIRDQFKADLPMRAIFEAPTIALLEATLAALPQPTGPDPSEPQLVARRREPRKLAQPQGTQS